MLISALCIPEQGAAFQVAAAMQAKEETPTSLFRQESATARPNTMEGKIMYQYPASRSQGQEQNLDHEGCPQGNTFTFLKDEEPFGRQYSKSQPPSIELACRARASMRQKRPTSDSEDDEDQEDGSGKKARLGEESASPMVYEFACPFYKRNRHRYCHQRSCRMSGWPSVHRVKEHLYRHHMHFVCDRCCSTFKVQDHLREHLRRELACTVVPGIVPEDVGFDIEVEKKLRSRKKIDGQNESDKWTHMFRLLFPSFKDKQTPSPYVDYSLRDETPLLPAQEDNAEIVAPVMPRSAVDHGNLLTMAAVAAAAEQQLAAVENNQNGISAMQVDQSAMIVESDCDGNPFIPLPKIPDVSDEYQLVSRSAFYKIVQDHVWTVLSTMPSPPVLPSPKDQD